MLTMPKEALPDPEMKYDRIPIAENHHPISHYSLARMGAEFLGGLECISEDGVVATFKDNLQENIGFAQGAPLIISSMTRPSPMTIEPLVQL